MKKKNWLAIFLAACTLFSFGACKKGKGDTNGSNNSGAGETQTQATNPLTQRGDKTQDGVHIINVSKSNHKLVDNGKSKYKLVYPDNAGSIGIRAVTEFQAYFRDATGVMLPSIKASEAEYTTDSEYIVFGNVPFTEEAMQNEFDWTKMNSSGYAIETVGNSIFVKGGSEYGVLNAAYELLSQFVNWRVYSMDMVLYDQNVKDLNLKNFMVFDVPDIQYPLTAFGCGGYQNSTWSHRFRMYVDQEIYCNKLGGHTVFVLLPKDTYLEEYPEWYTADQMQLCYTARGDADKYEKMVSTMVETLKGYFIANPNHNRIGVTQMDFAVWCQCEKCQEIVKKYGAEAATQTLFINDVATRLEKWANEEQDGRKLEIVVFAYHKTEKAPVKEVINESGDVIGYEPSAPEMVLHPSVAVWFAPISAFYNQSIYSEANKSTYELFKAWSVLASQMQAWYYDVNFSYYMIPNNTFGAKQDWYRVAQEYNIELLFNQGTWNTMQSTAFTNLKSWLNSKFSWNVEYDYQTLLNQFFTDYFGPAGNVMRKYFDQLEANLSCFDEKLGSLYSPIRSQTYWKKPLLNSWLKLFDDAYKAIEPIKESNENLYELYRKHIELESLTVYYLLVELYATTFSETRSAELKTTLAYGINNHGIQRLSEPVDGPTYAASLLASI
ncbi:MAG: DUF4838 domain-containing protein [Clostridia bacterium]|nr:DUF4838 domain-containing protein [Clostridia bacterium]